MTSESEPNRQTTPGAQNAGTEEEYLAAAVGPNWQRHYRRAFAAFRTTPSIVPRVWWNWAAAIVPFWGQYRRLAGVQFFSVVVFLVLLRPFSAAARGIAPSFTVVQVKLQLLDAGLRLLLAAIVAYVTVGALQGLFGDWLLYRRARKVAKRAGATSADPKQVARECSRWAPEGSVREYVAHGLTSALLGGVFLYLLVMISPGLFAGSRDASYVLAMKTELYELVQAQKSYRADSGRYASVVPPAVSATPGVTITIGTATARGWNATATHSVGADTCGFFVGTAPPPIEGAKEARPVCTFR